MYVFTDTHAELTCTLKGMFLASCTVFLRCMSEGVIQGLIGVSLGLCMQVKLPWDTGMRLWLEC